MDGQLDPFLRPVKVKNNPVGFPNDPLSSSDGPLDSFSISSKVKDCRTYKELYAVFMAAVDQGIYDDRSISGFCSFTDDHEHNIVGNIVGSEYLWGFHNLLDRLEGDEGEYQDNFWDHEHPESLLGIEGIPF